MKSRLSADNNYTNSLGTIQYAPLLQKYLEFRVIIQKSIMELSDDLALDVNRHVVANNVSLLATGKIEEQLKLSNIDESYAILKIDFKSINDIIKNIAMTTIWNEYSETVNKQKVFQKDISEINDFLEINIFDKTITVKNSIIRSTSDVLNRLKIAISANNAELKSSLNLINDEFEKLSKERSDARDDITKLNYGKHLNRFFEVILTKKVQKIEDQIRIIDKDISKTKSGIKSFEDKIALIDSLLIFFSNSSMLELLNTFKSRLNTLYGEGFVIERAIEQG